MDILLTSQRGLLILLAAIGYALIAILMKLIAQNGSSNLLVAGLGLFFILIVLTEVRLLQQMELSNVYITIIAVETLIVLGYAAWVGESLSLRELGGATMVIGGTILVSTA